MQRFEIKSTLSLGSIMAFRMLGLFMIYPVFSVYAKHMGGATPTLIGIALGCYGLTQALLQIPLGLLSDHFGRKPIITIGLIIFAIGSVIAALSTSIYGIILGRALQGAGAVGSTVLALLADLTCDENRTKAMAGIGLIIGLSFTVAMVAGPILNNYFHLAGIFWTTALLALLGIMLLYVFTPNPPKIIIHSDTETIPKQIVKVLTNPELLYLNYGIFALHTILTATFFLIPIILNNQLHLTRPIQTELYLGILLAAFLCMLPFIILAEKKRHFKLVFVGAIFTLLLTQLLLMMLSTSLMHMALILFLFFTAFTLLEASLPSLISKMAPIRNKGTAMGIYSSCQFFGIFLGGALGGWIYGHFQSAGVFIFSSGLAAVWLLLALSMPAPRYLKTLILKLSSSSLPPKILQELKDTPGITELALSESEGLLFLKLDPKIIHPDELRKRIGAGNLA